MKRAVSVAFLLLILSAPAAPGLEVEIQTRTVEAQPFAFAFGVGWNEGEAVPVEAFMIRLDGAPVVRGAEIVWAIENGVAALQSAGDRAALISFSGLRLPPGQVVISVGFEGTAAYDVVVLDIPAADATTNPFDTIPGDDDDDGGDADDDGDFPIDPAGDGGSTAFPGDGGSTAVSDDGDGGATPETPTEYGVRIVAPASMTQAETVTLTAEVALARNPVTYRWEVGEAAYDTASVTLVGGEMEAGAWTIRLTILDGDSRIASDTATLTVEASDYIPVAVEIDGPAAVEPGETASYTATARYGTPYPGGTYAFQWSTGDGDTGASSTIARSWSTEGVHTLSVTVNDAAFQSVTATLDVTVGAGGSEGSAGYVICRGADEGLDLAFLLPVSELGRVMTGQDLVEHGFCTGYDDTNPVVYSQWFPEVYDTAGEAAAAMAGKLDDLREAGIGCTFWQGLYNGVWILVSDPIAAAYDAP